MRCWLCADDRYPCRLINIQLDPNIDIRITMNMAEANYSMDMVDRIYISTKAIRH